MEAVLVVTTEACLAAGSKAFEFCMTTAGQERVERQSGNTRQEVKVADKVMTTIWSRGMRKRGCRRMAKDVLRMVAGSHLRVRKCEGATGERRVTRVTE